jgi:hypothetical protein
VELELKIVIPFKQGRCRELTAVLRTNNAGAENYRSSHVKRAEIGAIGAIGGPEGPLGFDFAQHLSYWST